jgi:hypothetical protein
LNKEVKVQFGKLKNAAVGFDVLTTSTQYRLVQWGKTASGSCSAGPRFVRDCSAMDFNLLFSVFSRKITFLSFMICTITAQIIEKSSVNGFYRKQN